MELPSPAAQKSFRLAQSLRAKSFPVLPRLPGPARRNPAKQRQFLDLRSITWSFTDFGNCTISIERLWLYPRRMKPFFSSVVMCL